MLDKYREEVETFKAWKEEQRVKEQKWKETIDSMSEELDFEGMTYAEIKELAQLGVGVSRMVELGIVQEKKRVEAYPALQRATYFPRINEIESLTDGQKKQLDSLFKKQGKNTVNIDNVTKIQKGLDPKKIVYITTEDQEKGQELLEQLVSKGVIGRKYALRCRCGGEVDSRWVTEEDVKKYDEYIELVKRCAAGFATDEDMTAYFNFELASELTCTNHDYCSGVDVGNLDSVTELLRGAKVYYYVQAEPDLTYEGR